MQLTATSARPGVYFTCTYLRRHSPGVGCAGITNCVDHVSDGGTPGSAVLCELTRHFHPVLSPLCVAEDSRSGSRSALIVVAHVFSWPPARLRHVRGVVGRRRSLVHLRDVFRHVQTSVAFFARVVPVCLQGRGVDAVPRMAHSVCP